MAKISVFNRIQLAVILIAIVALIYGLIEPLTFEWKEYTLTSKEIPQAFDGFTILFLTDFHYDSGNNSNRLTQLVKEVNACNADLILLGGDYVSIDDDKITECFSILKGLSSKNGVYATLGNHDHWDDGDAVLSEFDKAGFVPLVNTGKTISLSNQSIRIAGVADLKTDKPDINKTLAGAQETDYVILVSHNPDYIEKLPDEKRVDAVLSGHTHGGQISFFGLFGFSLPSKYGNTYRTGRVEKRQFTVLISNGLGTVGLPIRFFTPPQILKIILKKSV